MPMPPPLSSAQAHAPRDYLVPDADIIDAARRFLEAECSPQLVRSLREPDSTGHAPELWRGLADGGWLGLAFEPEHGGSGASLVDLGTFYRECGRVLMPTTAYSTLAAALFLSRLGSEHQRARFLPAIVQGEIVASFAHAEACATRDWRFFDTLGRERADGSWELTGRKLFVPNAHLAGLLVVLVRLQPLSAPERLGCFLVEPPTQRRIQLEDMATFGHDRQSALHFDGVVVSDGDRLAGPDPAAGLERPADEVFEVLTALQCMEMVGGAERVLEITVDHVCTREQFGRPIGAFQAVQHHVANMGMLVEGAYLLSINALKLLSDGGSAAREVSMAKAWTSQAYKDVTLLAHQLCGGMGYVLETDLHLWSERAKACEVTLGTREEHFDRLAAEVLA